MTDQKPVRRVGVFTMGISLISSGVALCLWQLCCIIICACITLSALGAYFTAEFPL